MGKNKDELLEEMLLIHRFKKRVHHESYPISEFAKRYCGKTYSTVIRQLNGNLAVQPYLLEAMEKFLKERETEEDDG